MFVLGNVLIGVAMVLDWILWGYQWILIARAVVSWVNPDPRNPIVQFLYAATEPLIRVARRMLPMNLRYFPLDIAFLVVVGLVIFARYGIVPSLFEMGVRLKGPMDLAESLSPGAWRATLGDTSTDYRRTK
jgi:YggT family protein